MKAGDLLYRSAKRILAIRQEAHQALDEFKGSLRGELTIGASSGGFPAHRPGGPAPQGQDVRTLGPKDPRSESSIIR